MCGVYNKCLRASVKTHDILSWKAGDFHSIDFAYSPLLFYFVVRFYVVRRRRLKTTGISCMRVYFMSLLEDQNIVFTFFFFNTGVR